MKAHLSLFFALLSCLAPPEGRAATILFGSDGSGGLSTITFVDGLTLNILNPGGYNAPFFLVLEDLYSNTGGQVSAATANPSFFSVDGTQRTVDQVSKGTINTIWGGDELVLRFGNGEGAVTGVTAGDLITVEVGTVVTLDTPILFPEHLAGSFNVYAADQPSFGDPMTVITGTAVASVPEPGGGMFVIAAGSMLLALRRRPKI